VTPVADPTLRVERALASSTGLVIGCDEVGRGALAGPVAVGLCVLDMRVTRRVPKGLRDSKMLAEPKREQLAPVAMKWSVAHAVGYASATEIDEIGIMACLGLAGLRAVEQLFELGVDVSASPILLDGQYDWLTPALSGPLTVHTRIKADRDCGSVAAASVISKVARDRQMIEHDGVIPGYGWARNKGYSTAEHMAAIVELGASELHRKTWLRDPSAAIPEPAEMAGSAEGAA
jgi:ribonuclease HII